MRLPRAVQVAAAAAWWSSAVAAVAMAVGRSCGHGRLGLARMRRESGGGLGKEEQRNGRGAFYRSAGGWG